MTINIREKINIDFLVKNPDKDKGEKYV